MRTQKYLILAVLFGFLGVAQGHQSETHIPSTVSPEWQARLKTIPDPASVPAFPAHDDLEGWRKFHQSNESNCKVPIGCLLDELKPNIVARKLGGVPVLDIKPKNWKDNGKVLIYTHGGAYTLFSAESTLDNSVPFANFSGFRVVSVDYTVAPLAKWEKITDQVINVFQALRKEGYALRDIAIYGDSAGGGLAAGAVLKMRDKGLGMPGAVVLWSPWSDITETGDTYMTLKDAELSYIYKKHLKPCADAYADPKDQKNSYVSPVYGDYKGGFPPTLIQGGTKEIFLSNFIRQYRVIDQAGIHVQLDLYEGMPHGFQVKLRDSPEAKTAYSKMNDFLRKHLDM